MPANTLVDSPAFCRIGLSLEWRADDKIRKRAAHYDDDTRFGMADAHGTRFCPAYLPIMLLDFSFISRSRRDFASINIIDVVPGRCPA